MEFALSSDTLHSPIEKARRKTYSKGWVVTLGAEADYELGSGHRLVQTSSQ